MKKLPYIEDYIKLMSAHILAWPVQDPVVKLARYDEPIVNSMSDQISNNVGFSDKQATLAHKIVMKYRRQWALAGYDVEHLQEPRYKLAIRTIDRSQVIDIVDKDIIIRFPYNQDMISYIRSAVTDVPGRLAFDRELRVWKTALIEPRLIWAKEFGAKYNFVFGSEFNRTLELMLGQDDYAIKLVKNDSVFEITNAAPSLNDYISDHGGFGVDNFINLVDWSGLLGYELDQGIYRDLTTRFSPDVIKLLLGREVNIEYENYKLNLEHIVKYAELTNRYPVYVYESGSSILRKELSRVFDESDITDLKTNPNLHSKGKVVYFSHWKLNQTNIPMLVTAHTLMIGNRRHQMIQAADKIVYYSPKIETQ